MNRRDFFEKAGLSLTVLITAIIAIPSIGYLMELVKGTSGEDDKLIPLGAVDSFSSDTYKIVEFKQTKKEKWRKKTSVRKVAVRKSGGDFMILSMVCTHLNCWVRWNDNDKKFVCPCHDGVYDEKGNVLDGPPPEPLNKFEYSVKEGKLFIKA